MRFRLLIPFAAVLALGACGEKTTPKPPLPTAVTAPIAPAAPGAETPATTTAAAPVAACPPQPKPVCPPAPAVHKVSLKAKPAVRHKVHRKAVRHKVTHGAVARVEPGLYPYKRYHGETRKYGYDERYHEHRGYPPPPAEDRYADREADHYHAYGQSGAVEHFADRGERYGYRQDDRRQDDRYSSGGRSYERYERHDSYGASDDAAARAYAEGRAEGYREGARDHAGAASSYSSSSSSYSERSYSSGSSSSGSSSSSYSERYEDGASYRRGEAGAPDGCCQRVSTGAAGRDPNGFLTWPGKVPAAPY
ncbi:hypothetical protein [Phenylobacterium sp.]|uniref:hypothetical protein n=1 Tax=Phenylobacterium sp. TaxID=1871053 RepID=UPI0035B4C799